MLSPEDSRRETWTADGAQEGPVGGQCCPSARSSACRRLVEEDVPGEGSREEGPSAVPLPAWDCRVVSAEGWGGMHGGRCCPVAGTMGRVAEAGSFPGVSPAEGQDESGVRLLNPGRGGGWTRVLTGRWPAWLDSGAGQRLGVGSLSKQLGPLLWVTSFKGVVVWLGDHLGLWVHGRVRRTCGLWWSAQGPVLRTLAGEGLRP